MELRLGYVAIATSLDGITTSKTITLTTYKKIGKNRVIEKIKKIIDSNLSSLMEILKYNVKNEIYFYRMSSNIFPIIKELDFDVLNYSKEKLKAIGEYINYNKIRTDIHLDHYYVLNSTKEEVVSSTINILNFYKNIFKFMGICGKIIMHVGGATNGKREGIKRFCNNFKLLELDTQEIIILENDDKIYNIKNVLTICTKLNIPMVLDYHHFMCNKTNEKIEDYIIKIFNTWSEKPKVHFSSPLDKKHYRSHHDYINVDDFLKFIDRIKFCNIDFDVMIEAKMKDEALFRLVRQIKYKTDYRFIGNTQFLV